MWNSMGYGYVERKEYVGQILDGLRGHNIRL